MRKKSIILAAVMGLLFSTTTNAATVITANNGQATIASEQEEIESERLRTMLVESVNRSRIANGVAAISVDTTLQADADSRAVETSSRFDHIRPDGTSSRTAISSKHNFYGENIAYYPKVENLTEKEVVEWIMDSWMHSQVHRTNLLDSKWQETGVGVHIDGDWVYVTQFYIQR